MKILHLSALLAASCLVAACAGYGPQSLPQGASIDATLASMGPPTGDMPLPNGGRRLEFARGPMGKHTYMLDFDAQGRLQTWEQVLSEARFNAITPGMSAAQVHEIIGHSFEKRVITWQKQVVWAYRFETPFCRWFQIGMDMTESTVIDTAYGPDPMCEGGDRFRR